DYCLADRSDRFAPLVGRLAHFAIFQHALSDAQVLQLYDASGQARAVKREPGYLVMGVREKAKPVDCKIHINGDGVKLGPVVTRGFLTAYQRAQPDSRAQTDSADSHSTAYDPNDFTLDAKQSGRLQLAAWLTHPDHPQTARVMVNRVWMHLFGQPIVATPDDFGVYGARPTHPQLLDHLADQFVHDGWSIKRLIRRLVLTRSYQLDSRANDDLINADPENIYQARHSRRRLDAETLRDSMLSATGSLDTRPGNGSAIEQINQLINWPPGEATDLHRDSNQRSIYLCMLRHAPPPDLAAFDLPDATAITGRRNETTLPTQALFLLNSPFVVQQSEQLASTLLSAPTRQKNDSPPGEITDVLRADRERVREAFERTLLREPSEAEMRAALAHVQDVKSTIRGQQRESHRTELRAWASLCQALLTTNEFRYID
ncbi:MAG: DUF1553 domain-containing protein, partial [Pirellulaceae bacterium]|nr:DUF1553 domain-containing protein [Pirellulaceae bacterium]